jgi:hypothetical protein
MNMMMGLLKGYETATHTNIGLKPL